MIYIIFCLRQILIASKHKQGLTTKCIAWHSKNMVSLILVVTDNCLKTSYRVKHFQLKTLHCCALWQWFKTSMLLTLSVAVADYAIAIGSDLDTFLYCFVLLILSIDSVFIFILTKNARTVYLPQRVPIIFTYVKSNDFLHKKF